MQLGQIFYEIFKAEIALQCLNNDKITVRIPAHPSIFSLEERVRLDASIPERIISTLPSDYDADMEEYLATLTEKQITENGLQDYRKFGSEWKFIFRKSKEGFLDLIWEGNGNTHELGYRPSTISMINGKNPDGSLITPEQAAIQCSSALNSCMFYQKGGDPDLVLFSKLKFENYKIEGTELSEDSMYVRTQVRAFSSTPLDNVAQALVLRNFGVKYLNVLLDMTRK